MQRRASVQISDGAQTREPFVCSCFNRRRSRTSCPEPGNYAGRSEWNSSRGEKDNGPASVGAGGGLVDHCALEPPRAHASEIWQLTVHSEDVQCISVVGQSDHTCVLIRAASLHRLDPLNPVQQLVAARASGGPAERSPSPVERAPQVLVLSVIVSDHKRYLSLSLRQERYCSLYNLLPSSEGTSSLRPLSSFPPRCSPPCAL